MKLYELKIRVVVSEDDVGRIDRKEYWAESLEQAWEYAMLWMSISRFRSFIKLECIYDERSKLS